MRGASSLLSGLSALADRIVKDPGSIGRYLITGCCLFLVDLGIVVLMVKQWGIAPEAAQVVGRTTGALLGFVAHRHFTFHHSVGSHRLKVQWQGGGYILLGVAMIIISPFILRMNLWLTDDRLVLAKVLTEIVIVSMTYVCLRLIFQGRKLGDANN